VPHVALTIALAFAAGMVVQTIARATRIPAIILLLVTGVVLGTEGLGWVRSTDLGTGLFMLVDFAVAIILFEGALNLRIRRLAREQRVIRRLVTWGAVVTLAGGAIAARVWLSWPWTAALLFGSLVVVTGPTVVSPLVRHLRLHPRLQTVLEAEGVLIDPIGALLATLVLQVTLASNPFGMVSEVGALLARLGIGTLVGILGGLAIAGLLRLPALVHGFENPLTLAMVVLLFHLSDYFSAPSGLLAVTVAGLVVGNLKSPVDEDLREFKDQLTVLMIGAVFVLLAADIRLADVRALGWPGIAVLATLVVLVRPAGVWLATAGAGMRIRERAFLSVIAPRGIVAAAIASITAGALGAEATARGQELRALVFLVIAGTVVVAGAVAWPLATLLKLRLPARDRVAILGAQGLGIVLARELRAAGQSVVLIDADPQRCRTAEAEGFSVVFGNALQERALRRIPIEHVGTVVGVTFNDNLNSQFVRLARHTFGVKHGFVSVDALDGDRPPEHVSRHGADVLFAGAHDQERWDVRCRQGDIEVVKVAYAPGEPAPVPGRPHRGDQDRFVMLTIERGGRVRPMSLSASTSPRRGDQSTVALARRERDKALAELAAAGWQPAAR
jgi:NhaP-type Na+/H+ or K+/H+ antiporter